MRKVALALVAFAMLACSPLAPSIEKCALGTSMDGYNSVLLSDTPDDVRLKMNYSPDYESDTKQVYRIGCKTFTFIFDDYHLVSKDVS